MNSRNTEKGSTKKIKEYTNRINYESKYEHKHSFWEIVTCVNGKINHYLNGFPSEFKQGNVILIKPDVYHYYKNIKTPQYEHIDLYVNCNVFLSLCNVISPKLYEALFSNKELMMVSLDNKLLEEIKDKLSQLDLVQNSSDKDLINSIYMPLAMDFIGMFSQKYFVSNNLASSEFFKFISKINTVEYICGSLENIVKLSNYSHGYLCKIFKEKMGIPLKVYHNELKVNYAIDLLKNKSLSILDISNTLGYNSLSNFIKMFKAYTGTTPKHYRKEFLNI